MKGTAPFFRDFIDDATRQMEIPEEYVRQEIFKSLAREYGYPKLDIAVEFKLKLCSQQTCLFLEI